MWDEDETKDRVGAGLIECCPLVTLLSLPEKVPASCLEVSGAVRSHLGW